MRWITLGMLGAAVLAVTSCGSSKPFANQPRPPIPINLTAYINDARVSVSPDSVGAGPVTLIVTNQGSHAESLQIQSPGAQSALADTGPINPQATAQVKVNVNPGEYTVATGSGGGTDAAQATSPSIHPAHLHVGPPRPGAQNALLQP
jgi:hypothetical protein